MRTGIFILTVLIYAMGFGQAESDKEAKEILDRVKNQIDSYTSIIADFEFNIKDKKEEINSTSTGTLYIKDSLYVIESPGSKVIFDGQYMWSYVEDINEVTITEPDLEDDDFIENPAKIFSFYERDFKLRLRGTTIINSELMYEIDLYPKNLNQPYSRYKIYVIKSSNMIYRVDAVSKDGLDYKAIIKNVKLNTAIKSSKFTFSVKDYPGVEQVDLRF